MNTTKTLILLLYLCICSCQPKQSLSSKLIGKWQMQQVLNLETDVSTKHNPNGNRWIQLNDDGTFISDGDPYGKNTGKWSIEKSTATLYLDSDAGSDDDSYWLVSFQADLMKWKGTKSDFTKRFTLTHKRMN